MSARDRAEMPAEPRSFSDALLDDLAARAACIAGAGFAAAGWKWGEPGEVPGQARIALTTRRLLREVALESTLSTGGFHVSRWIEDDEEHVSISLELASASAAIFHESGEGR